MKIVVIGGSGLIGSKLVNRLRQKGHEALPASPNSGVNTITGEGLAEALAGAQVVVDVANSPSFDDAAVLKFFETSGTNLLAAEARAGVRYHQAVADALDRVLRATGTMPRSITVDHGTELTSRAFEDWAWGHGVQLDFIIPASPWKARSSKASTAACATNA
jgi:uncharacterized protein YbjT (DUF2867 family)